MQVKGVKGACILSTHVHFDLSRGAVIDVMHCVFLGIVAKSFMKYWFDPIHRLGAYSIKGKVSVAIYRKLGNFCCENTWP